MLLDHLEVEFFYNSTTKKSSYDSLPRDHISKPMHGSSCLSSEKVQCLSSEKDEKSLGGR